MVRIVADAHASQHPMHMQNGVQGMMQRDIYGGIPPRYPVNNASRRPVRSQAEGSFPMPYHYAPTPGYMPHMMEIPPQHGPHAHPNSMYDASVQPVPHDVHGMPSSTMPQSLPPPQPPTPYTAVPPSAQPPSGSVAAAAAAAAASGAPPPVMHAPVHMHSVPSQSSIHTHPHAYAQPQPPPPPPPQPALLPQGQPGAVAFAARPAPIVPTSGPTPTVYLATYSSVPVYEITVRGIALMRRRSDGYLNATQILKIAGIEKARRTRILEKEILTGEHDKVQGGYGTFQGTWIPLQRAQELAISYNVYHLIRPLLDFDPTASRAVTAQQQGAKRKAESSVAAVHTTGAVAAGAGAGVGPGLVAGMPGSAPSAVPGSSGGSSSSSITPMRAPHQQPRFLTLRPPRSSTLGATAGGLVHTLPRDDDLPAMHASEGVPPGSHPTQRTALESYATHGYTPQGVPLPPAENAASAAGAGSEPLRSSDTNAHVHDLNVLSATPLHSAAPPSTSVDDPAEVKGPRFADKAVPPHLGDERERRAREVLTGLFVHESVHAGAASASATSKSPAASTGPTAASSSNAPLDQLHALLHELGVDPSRRQHRSPLNLVIDDHGHTALHWAAALCRLSLVRMLTALPPSCGGANVFVGNYAGETALHRSVLVTNAYELSQLPELLDILAASLETRDHRKRTVLHHIALVAGLKGRAAPARYYLSCVLDRISKDASTKASLLDAQDDEGETALSIAARLGNTNMIKMLLDAGARKDLPNYLGITPLDWGISNASPDGGVLQELGSYRPADVVRSLMKPSPGPVKKSQDVREKLVQTLDELQVIFDREVNVKQNAIETTQTHLQAATRELAARRRDIQAAQAAVTEREEVRQRCENLQRALALFPAADQQSAGRDNDQKNQDNQGDGHTLDLQDRVPPSAWFDAPLAEADAALAQDASESAQVAAIVRLRWLLMHCDEAMKSLRANIQERQDQVAAQQAQYHRVVALCAQVPPDKVDGLLDELLAAVESIGSDVDTSSVASFMDKVSRAQSMNKGGAAASGIAVDTPQTPPPLLPPQTIIPPAPQSS